MTHFLLKIISIALFLLFVANIAVAQQAERQTTNDIDIKVSVFPNPSPTQIFSVAVHSPHAQKVQIMVLDAFQRLIFSKTIISDYALYTLNLSHRPRGWYYLVLVTARDRIVKRLESM